MTHLSPEQLIDLVEERADAGALAHARACDRCRAELDGLRSALALTAADPVPEPSPLFWEHFSSRVGAAVRAEAGTRAGRAAWVWRWAAVSALGAAVLVTVLVLAPRDARREAARAAGGPAPAVAGGSSVAATPRLPGDTGRRPAGDSAAAVQAAAVPGGLEVPAAGEDASWMFVRDLSQELTVEEAGAVLPAGPGAADRALGELSDEERTALVDLIRAEMARGSVREPAPSGR